MGVFHASQYKKEEGTGGVRPHTTEMLIVPVMWERMRKTGKRKSCGCEDVLQWPKSSVVTWVAKGALVTQ